MKYQMGSPSDDATPVHCSSEIFLFRYGYNWRQVHQLFLAENNIPCTEVPAFPIPGTRTLLQEIHDGIRRMDWCPRGVNLYDHLYPFFLSRDIGFWTKLSDSTFKGLTTAEGAWLVSANRNVCRDRDEHRDRARKSGFHERVVSPCIVQLLYLIALAEYRGSSFVNDNMPYRSEDSMHLTFVRSGTRLSLNGREQILAVAYVPHTAVCIWPIPTAMNRKDMVTPDIFLLREAILPQQMETG